MSVLTASCVKNNSLFRKTFCFLLCYFELIVLLSGHGENCNEDIACLTIAHNDRLGLEAIRSLHRQLDDDANGNVDLSESDEACNFCLLAFGQLNSHTNLSSTNFIPIFLVSERGTQV